GVGAGGGVRVGLSVEDVVLGRRSDDAHWARLLTAELVAFLPASALGLTLQLWVGKLDALVGHVSGCEVASSFGFGALLPRWLARRAGPQLRLRVGVVGVVRSVSVICISTLGEIGRAHV